MKWNKWCVGLMAGLATLCAVQTFGQLSIPVPINPALENVSNATVSVTTNVYSGSPYVVALPAGTANQYPFTLLISCVAPSNSLISATVNSETNPLYIYGEYVYSTLNNGLTNTTTEPITNMVWAGTNVWTQAFYQYPSNRVGAASLTIDKITSQSSNQPNFSVWIVYPN